MRTDRRGNALIVPGVLLILAAMALTAYNLWDEAQAAQAADQALTLIMQELPTVSAPTTDEPTPDTPTFDAPGSDVPLPSMDEVEIPNYILNPEMDMPQQTVDGLSYIGILEIPALNLSLPIISQWSSSASKTAPCRYVGSAYTNDLVIAGHNYRSHFANLKNVPEGSPVYFTDMDGNRFEYRVAVIETLHGTDVEAMTGGGWDLSLFTCTMNGQYRATVRCNLTSPR